MKIKKTISSIASSIMCLTLLTSNVIAVESNQTVFDDTVSINGDSYMQANNDTYYSDVSNEATVNYNIAAENLCKDFINKFYTNIYATENSSFTKEYFNSTGLSDYVDLKSAIMKNRSSAYGIVSDFSISSTIEDCSHIEFNNENLYTIWVEVKFKYPGCDTFSGFGRTAQVLIKNVDNNPIISDLFINDDIDETIIGNSISSKQSMRSLTDWNSMAYTTEIQNNLQELYNYEQSYLLTKISDIDASETDNFLTTYAASSVTTAQRNKIVSYAKNNCSKTSPSSGNSTYASYYDFSQISGNYDCTNFASHCLLAGGAVEYDTGNAATGWYYNGLSQRSYSWSGVTPFGNFIITNTQTGPKGKTVGFTNNCPMSSMMYSIGDIIQIDYEPDGTYNHSTIVTGFQQNISGSGNSFTPKVTSRSGAYSGFSKWYNNDTSIVDAGYANPNYSRRVIHLTSLS